MSRRGEERAGVFSLSKREGAYRSGEGEEEPAL